MSSTEEEDSVSQCSSIGVTSTASHSGGVPTIQLLPELDHAPRSGSGASCHSQETSSQGGSSCTGEYLGESSSAVDSLANTLLAQTAFLKPLGESLSSGAQTVAYRPKESGAFKRKSADRHSVHGGVGGTIGRLEEFGLRRSPKNAAPGKWTDVFSSKRLRRKINTALGHENNEDSVTHGSFSDITSTSEADVALTQLSSSELDRKVAELLGEKNLPAEKIKQTLETMPTETKRQLLKANYRSEGEGKRSRPKAYVNQLVAGLGGPVEDMRKLLISLRVSLSSEGVRWVDEFATFETDMRGEPVNGLGLISRMIHRILALLIEVLEAKGNYDHSIFPTALAMLKDCITCINRIANTYPGLSLVMRKRDASVRTLLETLLVLNTRKPEEDKRFRKYAGEVIPIRADILKMISLFAVINENICANNCKIEMNGIEKVERELNALAAAHGCHKWQPVISTLECISDDPSIEEQQCLYKVLAIVNFATNSQFDELPEEQAWQMRMKTRSEVVHQGLAKYQKRIVLECNRAADTEPRRNATALWETFNAHRDDDFSELVNRLDTVKQDYDTLEGCAKMLDNAEQGQREADRGLLLSIMHFLMLIPEGDSAIRLSYLRLIESCVSEIVLHRGGVHPNFQAPFVFETPVQEMIDMLSDSDITRRLDAAVQAKQEAVARQQQYWLKLDEFRKEAEQLRKHVADSSIALPPKTECTLPPPDLSCRVPALSGLPPVKGGPPPPPGLPPITGGPPPPPPLPGTSEAVSGEEKVPNDAPPTNETDGAHNTEDDCETATTASPPEDDCETASTPSPPDITSTDGKVDETDKESQLSVDVMETAREATPQVAQIVTTSSLPPATGGPPPPPPPASHPSPEDGASGLPPVTGGPSVPPPLPGLPPVTGGPSVPSPLPILPPVTGGPSIPPPPPGLPLVTGGPRAPPPPGLPPVTGGPSGPPPPSGLPPVTGGPPPPPGLPAISGGPPAPPPPPGLPRVTGGPPPPPPLPGLPAVSGGPPAPPPPPPPTGSGPPPPPPLPGVRGPPGPPPPPPPGGGPRGPPVPPPPPGAFVVGPPPLPTFLRKKKDVKVGVQLRKIPWNANVIQPQQLAEGCFWAQTEEERLANDSFIDNLKERFASSKPGAAFAAAAVATRSKPGKTPQFIQDGKMLQALAILYGSAKKSYQQWVNGILQLDDNLSAATLQQLRQALPPPELLKELASADRSTFEKMPEGEQFAASVAAIPALPIRLDLLIFRQRLEEIVNDIKPGISAIMESCEEVRSSSGFKLFLELVLLSGNIMAASGPKHENTFAFEFSVLPKLANTKDVENKWTLLHFLILQMQKHGGERKARFAIEDLYHAGAAARVNADEVAKAVTQFKGNVTKLENHLRTYKPAGEGDRFAEVMRPFLQKAQQELLVIETMHQKMQSDWDALVKFYAFNSKKYKMENFFDDVKTFKEQYESAYRELEAERVREERERRDREKEKERPPLRAVQDGQAVRTPKLPGGGSITPSLTTALDTPGVLDELDKMMNSGMLHRTGRTPRQAGAPRSRAAKAALQRQRSRGGDVLLASAADLAVPQDGPRKINYKVRRVGQPTVEMSMEVASTPTTNELREHFRRNENTRPAMASTDGRDSFNKPPPRLSALLPGTDDRSRSSRDNSRRDAGRDVSSHPPPPSSDDVWERLKRL